MNKRLSVPEMRERLQAISEILHHGGFDYLRQELEAVIKELRHVRRRQAHSQPRSK